MAQPTLRYWTTYSLLGVLVLFGALFVVYAYEHTKPVEEHAAATSSPTVISSQPAEVPVTPSSEDDWMVLYPNTLPMKIGEMAVEASVAQTWPERIKGLSDTPYLPAQVVKLFVFDSVGLHSIWMKDMQYAIDIIWLDNAGTIIHIVEGAAPESYPAMFVPESDARYVIETVEGFVSEHGVTLGTKVTLPNL